MRPARIVALLAVAFPLAVQGAPPPGASRTIEFRFTATGHTQVALWIESADGRFAKTVKLTQAVALYGIGNRPGAAQMNSGFHWPYGRREGVLPIWAHRRAAASDAAQFKRVIFQDRSSEGFASRTSNDSTPESYFCLSFSQSTTPEARRRDAMDAVTCASAFSSDKGRFLSPTDGVYAEPAEMGQIGGQVGMMRPLDLVSLYPPRRDVTSCRERGCTDTVDVAEYEDHVRAVMPDIDTVTMATPPADMEQSILFTAPDNWENGDYVAWLEVNVEGDYNAAFNDRTYRTPQDPANKWDIWALTYGYAYRGQPSVVFQVPFALGPSGSFQTAKPAFYGDVNGFGPDSGIPIPIDDKITDDPVNAPGSGADRLRVVAPNDYRFKVAVRGTELCQSHEPPRAPKDVGAAPDADEKHSHQWGHLHFVVPTSDTPIVNYEVRYSTSEINLADPSTFEHALPAVAAKIDTEALMVPTGGAAGTDVDVDFGGMNPVTPYYVALRAVDMCNVAGPYAVAKMTTTRINFTQLSGCFVATAAFGSELEPQVNSLRVLRDALRPRSTLFAAATDLYYRTGPAAAAVIAPSDAVRAVVRTLLGPVVEIARAVAPLAKSAPPAPPAAPASNASGSPRDSTQFPR